MGNGDAYLSMDGWAFDLLPGCGADERQLSSLVSLKNFCRQPLSVTSRGSSSSRHASAADFNAGSCSLFFGGLSLPEGSGPITVRRNRSSRAKVAVPTFASVSAPTQQRVASFALPRLSSDDSTSGVASGVDVASGVAVCTTNSSSPQQRQQQQHLPSDRRRRRAWQRDQGRDQEEEEQRHHREGDGSWRYLKRLLSGAISSVVSRTAVAPLERVKLELVLRNTARKGAITVATDILAAEGLLGFWKGHLLNVLRTTPYKALNYSSYDFYKQQLTRLSIAHNVDDKFGRFVAGAMAGVTALTICFPLDVVRTRLLATGGVGRPLGGVPRALREIVAAEGLAGMYTGMLPALVSIAPSGAVFYGTYDLLREWHVRRLKERGEVPPDAERVDIGAVASLLNGAAAGAAAELAVYPLEVVRRRMQLQSLQQSGGKAVASALAAAGTAPVPAGSGGVALARFSDAVLSILRTEGAAGFYAGMLPNMLQVLPSAALSYYTYELLKRSMHAT